MRSRGTNSALRRCKDVSGAHCFFRVIFRGKDVIPSGPWHIRHDDPPFASVANYSSFFFLASVLNCNCAAADNCFLPLPDLLKNKSRPEAASDGAAEWVKSEREMRERLEREREAREVKEKADVRIVA